MSFYPKQEDTLKSNDGIGKHEYNNRYAGIGRQFPLRMEGSKSVQVQVLLPIHKNVICYILSKDGLISEGDNKYLSKSFCIYRVNSDKNKMYIGSVMNIAQHFRQHRYKSSIHKMNNNKLYNLIKKYGWNIEYGVIEKAHFIYNSHEIT